MLHKMKLPCGYHLLIGNELQIANVVIRIRLFFYSVENSTDNQLMLTAEISNFIWLVCGLVRGGLSYKWACRKI